MKKQMILFLAAASFILSGCVVRSYTVTKDRVDQDLGQGNRGFLMGRSSSMEQGERKKTRTTRVVEMEWESPFKFKKNKKEISSEQDVVLPEQNFTWNSSGQADTVQEISQSSNEPQFKKYTVQKNDTLQKISSKFYSTTKKWVKIYDANKDVLKAPNRIYPGQILNIPVYAADSVAMLEPEENLK